MKMRALFNPKAGALLVVLCALAFAWVAAGVTDGRWVAANTAAMRSVEVEHTPGLTRLALAVTWLAGWTGTVVVVGVLAVVFLVRRRDLDAATLLMAVGGGWVLELVLKPLFAIARPEVFPHLTQAGGFSFPSGHALRGTAVFGFLAGLLVAGRPAAGRWLLALVCVLVAVAVCWSRVYLGVHWPTDVIAGALAATAWVVVCLSARHYAMIRRGFTTETQRTPSRHKDREERWI
jgi:undecaprenyl-diphosphatase